MELSRDEMRSTISNELHVLYTTNSNSKWHPHRAFVYSHSCHESFECGCVCVCVFYVFIAQTHTRARAPHGMDTHNARLLIYICWCCCCCRHTLKMSVSFSPLRMISLSVFSVRSCVYVCGFADRYACIRRRVGRCLSCTFVHGTQTYTHTLFLDIHIYTRKINVCTTQTHVHTAHILNRPCRRPEHEHELQQQQQQSSIVYV